jgi:hypothetical protein
MIGKMKTPQTDDLARGNHVVPTEWAEQLERERDEAREHLREIKEYGTEEINAAVELRQKLATALAERDEAQKELSSIYRWIERNHADGFIDSLTYLKNLERVMDCWYDRLDKIERERDEARDQSQRLRVQLNHYTQANEMAEQAFRERDESHKIAERAIDDLAWFNETNAKKLRAELNQLKEGEK